jgi:hypothetical protein
MTRCNAITAAGSACKGTPLCHTLNTATCMIRRHSRSAKDTDLRAADVGDAADRVPSAASLPVCKRYSSASRSA